MLNAGDVVSLLLVDALMKENIPANDAFVLFSVIFLLSGILQHVLVSEVDREREEDRTSIGAYMAESVAGLRIFLSHPKHALWFCCNVLLDNFYDCTLLWMPFYLSRLGFSDYNSLISMMFPLLGMLSVFIVNNLFKFCETQK